MPTGQTKKIGGGGRKKTGAARFFFTSVCFFFFFLLVCVFLACRPRVRTRDRGKSDREVPMRLTRFSHVGGQEARHARADRGAIVYHCSRASCGGDARRRVADHTTGTPVYEPKDKQARAVDVERVHGSTVRGILTRRGARALEAPAPIVGRVRQNAGRNHGPPTQKSS